MSKFMGNLTAINPFERQRSTPPIEVMADTSLRVLRGLILDFMMSRLAALP